MPRTKLGGITTSELQAEIRRRKRSQRKLRKQRTALVRKLAQLDAQLEASGGAGGRARGRKRRGRRVRRARNKVSLAGTLVKVLSATKPATVMQAMEAVKQAGYKTKSRTFRTIVNQTLLKDKRFKKAKRGQYVLA